MSCGAGPDVRPPRRRRIVAWGGPLFIAAIVAIAAWDIVRGYHASIDDTGRQLQAQAQSIAEQTARSIQAVDVVLRHVAGEYRRGRLSRLAPDELHTYLRELSVGMVQIGGFGLYDANGDALAQSWTESGKLQNIAELPGFVKLRDDPTIEFGIGMVRRSPDDGRWILPLGRRLQTPDGAFAGIVGAIGSIDYFQEFYRDVKLPLGTAIALMHRRGELMARFPPAEEGLGQPFMPARIDAAQAGMSRIADPVDRKPSFAVRLPVPALPLDVLVTRDVDTALAPWRASTQRTVLTTLALALFASLLLAVVANQLRRLYSVHGSLAASRERFELAAAGSDVGVWDWDFTSGLAFESARARELQGLPPGPDVQPLPALLQSLRVHEQDVPRRAEAIRAHLAGETPAYECEYRVCHADGTARWVRARALCIRDAAGKPVRMAGSVSDIDARRRAEESLRQSEERYALAMAGSSGGHWVWDVGTDVLYGSDTLNQLFGLPRDQKATTRRAYFAQVRVHPDDWPRVRQTTNDLVDGRVPRADFEFRIELPGSCEQRWIMTRARCFQGGDGKPVRVAGVSIDVTERKRMEEALRASEERYQLAVAGSNQGLWDWDLRTDLLFLSARAQAFMGLPPSEPVRSRREWIACSPFHPDDRPRVRSVISAHLRGETEHYSVEYRLRHTSGKWVWHRQRGLALRDADGRPYRMAGSMEDISDRKDMEAERDQLQGQLLQAKKLEAIGTLAGGIAHDFNNILSAILGYGEMAQQDAPEGSAQRRHIDAAMSAGMRAKSLVERILAFSRSGVAERVPVHVQAVVAEALDAVAASLPGGVRLERHLSADGAAVLGDPTQVHQVVMNLCANAVQAMKSQGTLTVTLDSIEEGCTHCATSTLHPGPYLRLAVHDTGVGIAPHLLERIFDPFFTTKDIGVGTGLGLSLVHGIVTDLGGGITVNSQLGEGSTFTVYLPCRDLAAVPAGAEEAPPTGAGETILLVDDEDMLVRLGEELIAQLGYEPVGFTSGKAALAALREAPERFDAVLSDEAMPEMTGSELARHVRALRADIPIVLMSGYVTPQLSARAREVGVVEVLAKPLVARDIARGLAAALRTPVGSAEV